MRNYLFVEKKMVSGDVDDLWEKRKPVLGSIIVSKGLLKPRYTV